MSQYISRFRQTQVAIAKDAGGYSLEEGRPITLRHLLTHTSGLSYGTGPASDLWENGKPSGMVLCRQGRTHRRFRFSNGRTAS